MAAQPKSVQPRSVPPTDPKTSSIGDRLWIDTNGNGVQDGGEAGLGGVTIQLLNAAGVVVATTTSAADGSYLFENLAADIYQLQFGTKDGYGFTSKDLGGNDANDSDANITTGRSQLVALGINEQNRTVDAGYVPLDPKTSSIGDRVWVDTNGDGIQNDGATGVPGVTVILKNTAGTTLATTTTGADGSYLFDKLAAGQYQVQFGNTPGYTFTGQDKGTDDANDSDANTSTGLSQVVSLGINQQNRTVDAGVVPLDPKTSSIGDYVWLDTNKDGVQNDGATGVSGVTVNLLDATGKVLATQRTGADGSYLFDKLAAGQYQVQFGNTPGYTFTGRDLGTDDAKDSDANTTTGLSQLVSLGIAQQVRTVDAGLVASDPKTAELGDRVWYDTNKNGVQDAGEAGVVGLTVKLRGAGDDGVFGTADDIAKSMFTGADGKYLFDHLAAGKYQVEIPRAIGYSFTGQDLGGNDATDSDVNTTTGLSQVVTLARAESNLTIDAGIYEVPLPPTVCAELGDRVWLDSNQNGLQDAGEVGLKGYYVTLLNVGADGKLGGTDDKVVAAQFTGDDGKYLFTTLAAGNYVISVANPTGTQVFTRQLQGNAPASDSDIDPTTQFSRTISLAYGESNRTIDAGIILPDTKTASLGDYVWLDANKNGQQDAGEAAVSGVTVRLYNASGVQVGNALTTGSDGKYLFQNLAAGDYQVQFDKTGYTYTTRDAVGVSDAVDSDASSTGRSQTVSLAIGQQNLTVDAGLVVVAPPPPPPPTAQLGDRLWIDTNKNGVQDLATELTGINGVKVTLTYAGKDGLFGTGDDTTATTFTANGTEPGSMTSSSGYYKFTSLEAGQYKVSFDRPADYVFTGRDLGTNDGLDSDVDTTTGTTQVVTLAAGQSNMTVDAGVYLTPPPPPSARLGDFVWLDTNKNGIQDAGEQGVAGVTMTLIPQGANYYAQTTTDANGYYHFDNLSAGTYAVSMNVPGTYLLTTANAAGVDDAKDSDFVVTSGTVAQTQWVTLVDGASNQTLDAGLYLAPPPPPSAGLGDFVWNDLNQNGIQDAGEPGLAGVLVKLVGANGVIDTKTTNADGAYSFTGLAAGSYYVNFTQAPAGFLPTTANAAGNSNDTKDSDSVGSNSQSVTLAAGEYNPTIDAGFYLPPPPLLGSIGDYVWYDGTKAGADGIQNTSSGETPFSNVLVQLYGANGTYYGSTHTDATGHYLFSNLSAGDYKVYFETPVATNGGGYGSVAGYTVPDSERNADQGGDGWTAVFHLDAGQNRRDIDAGYFLGSPIALDLDGNGIQTTALADSTGKFDLMETGTAINSGWLSKGDAFLAVDSNGNGKIDSRAELFGGDVGEGFAKLAGYDTNHDGFVDAKDAGFKTLLVWQDLNGDHQSSANELRSLANAGIASLKVEHTWDGSNQNGNTLGETSTATRADGSSMAMVDVYFAAATFGPSAVPKTVAAAETSTIANKLAHLLQPVDDLLHQAFGHGNASEALAGAATANVDGGDTLRQMLAHWNAHHSALA